jgi:hypothetical protein
MAVTLLEDKTQFILGLLYDAASSLGNIAGVDNHTSFRSRTLGDNN